MLGYNCQVVGWKHDSRLTVKFIQYKSVISVHWLHSEPVTTILEKGLQLVNNLNQKVLPNTGHSLGLKPRKFAVSYEYKMPSLPYYDEVTNQCTSGTLQLGWQKSFYCVATCFRHNRLPLGEHYLYKEYWKANSSKASMIHYPWISTNLTSRLFTTSPWVAKARLFLLLNDWMRIWVIK